MKESEAGGEDEGEEVREGEREPKEKKKVKRDKKEKASSPAILYTRAGVP
jgi:hypothetical protein